MKKTNFLVIFWLLLALISFVVALINVSSLLNNISYLIIPSSDDYYMSKENILRGFITSIPMLLLCLTTFFFGLKQGLRLYKEK